ncbi:MAG TPA: four helix bundle protein [Pyrinomonadaceae bacterium]|nr:four helix bundle protein [Pyrinomonadaceae bacterium]
MDILQEKAYAFALRIVKLCEYLNNERKEFVLSKKLLDSGTNIGLFIEEGKQGENRPDFIQKYSLANKEAFKSHFLLRLVRDSKYIGIAHAESFLQDCGELQALLITSLRTTRQNE